MTFDGAQPSIMQKNNVIKSLQSFIVLPFLAMNLIAGPTGLDLNLVGTPYFGEKGQSLSEETLKQERELEEKAAKIDKYFADKNLPAAGLGKKMVLEAEKNGLPWALPAAILMAESTALKFPCPNDPENGFGWASCKYVDFESADHAIEVVAANLGGNNPKTALYQFLKENKNFQIDKAIDNKILISVAPDGYIRRVG